jgi:shikimate kinase
MNIVLIGYRGTGKSVVGKLVARRLGMECVSMDARIVEKVGMSIPEIVATHDWPTFRDMESEVARELAKRDHLVIDTGGGVIERPENMETLGKNGLIVWLKASPGLIVSRIADGTERPSLTGKSFTEEVAEVLERRTPKYQAAAQYEIATEQLTPEQVADGIIAICRSLEGGGRPHGR